MARHDRGAEAPSLRLGRISGAGWWCCERAGAQSRGQRRRKRFRSSLWPDDDPHCRRRKHGRAYLAFDFGFALLAAFAFGLSGRCVNTDAASVLISVWLSAPGSFSAFEAIFPAESPDLSILAIHPSPFWPSDYTRLWQADKRLRYSVSHPQSL